MGAMDKELSGEVAWKEFRSALEDPRVDAYLRFLGLDASHLYDIFTLIDVDDSGTIRLTELLEGIAELQGPAKKVEVLRLEKLLHKVVGGRSSSGKLSNSSCEDAV